MREKGNLLLALLMIVVGAYLLLTELGMGLPGWERIWPVLPLVGGLTLLVTSVVEPGREPDRVFFGTVATLVGVVFLTITMGPLTYRDLGSWWPIFALIGGVGFLAQWAAAGLRDWDALFLALVSLCIAAVGLALAFQLLGPNTREILPELWPAVLILAGLMALLRGVLSRRRR